MAHPPPTWIWLNWVQLRWLLSTILAAKEQQKQKWLFHGQNDHKQNKNKDSFLQLYNITSFFHLGYFLLNMINFSFIIQVANIILMTGNEMVLSDEFNGNVFCCDNIFLTQFLGISELFLEFEGNVCSFC